MKFSVHVVCFFFFFLAAAAAATASFKVPRLSIHDPRYGSHHLAGGKALASTAAEDFESYFYNQTLDHFNYRPESYVTFRQRYVVNSKHWGGAGAPIFVLLGDEAPLNQNLSGDTTFLIDIAPSFGALLVYIEHRYYGDSIPFGSREEAFRNASTLGYMSSQQAIADYAEIILHVKEQFKAEDSPVIVVGGSYGGMLATWFRLKYPHIAIGALASSAPILYFDDITPQDAYLNVVTKGFRDASETCYKTIKKSWTEIDETASKSDGLSTLGRKFKTCVEMVMSIGYGNDTIFGSKIAFNLTKFSYECRAYYGVAPRPHWVTTNYGGHSIKRILKRFGSNIIFFHGLKGPYSSGGVVENISDTIYVVYTNNGSHCLDLHQSLAIDPQWLITQREEEINIMRGWLTTYYKDL